MLVAVAFAMPKTRPTERNQEIAEVLGISLKWVPPLLLLFLPLHLHIIQFRCHLCIRPLLHYLLCYHQCTSVPVAEVNGAAAQVDRYMNYALSREVQRPP